GVWSATDGPNGYELWRSDGTGRGTSLVKDVNPGPGNSYPRYLTNFGGTLFFNATDGTNGPELWRSDGSGPGTTLVKDINPSGGSFPRDLTDVGGTLFFNARDGTSGRELWKAFALLSPPGPTPAAPAPAFNLKAAIKKCKKKFPKAPQRKRCIKKAKKRAGTA